MGRWGRFLNFKSKIPSFPSELPLLKYALLQTINRVNFHLLPNSGGSGGWVDGGEGLYALTINDDPYLFS